MPTLAVATDFSPAAEPALALARRWSQQLAASVLLLHVVPDPELAPALANDVAGDVAAATKALAVLAKTFTGGPVACEVGTAEDVAAEIVRRAAAHRADWLIVGTNGRTGLQRLRLGSVAAKVVRTAERPVVCVPVPA